MTLIKGLRTCRCGEFYVLGVLEHVYMLRLDGQPVLCGFAMGPIYTGTHGANLPRDVVFLYFSLWNASKTKNAK